MNIKSSFNEFGNVGVGKALVIVANGYSLEEEIEVLKKYKDNVDIMVCDKAMGHLFNHGITPNYVVVCDANVSYDKYMKPWEDKVSDSVLFINAAGNTKWSRGTWKNRVLFCNEDSINSQIEFSQLSGCTNFLPAATNVSNQMLVLATQCTNKGRNNWFGYDKIVLLGYDYCWRPDGKYYAFCETGEGKKNYMRHSYVLDRDFRPAFSSSNLIFSAKWLDDYLRNFQLPVVVGSKSTILQNAPVKNLEEQLQYSYRKEDQPVVIRLIEIRSRIMNELGMIDGQLNGIGQDHFLSFQQSI